MCSKNEGGNHFSWRYTRAFMKKLNWHDDYFKLMKIIVLPRKQHQIPVLFHWRQTISLFCRLDILFVPRSHTSNMLIWHLCQEVVSPRKLLLARGRNHVSTTHPLIKIPPNPIDHLVLPPPPLASHHTRQPTCHSATQRSCAVHRPRPSRHHDIHELPIPLPLSLLPCTSRIVITCPLATASLPPAHSSGPLNSICFWILATAPHTIT